MMALVRGSGIEVYDIGYSTYEYDMIQYCRGLPV